MTLKNIVTVGTGTEVTAHIQEFYPDYNKLEYSLGDFPLNKDIIRDTSLLVFTISNNYKDEILEIQRIRSSLSDISIPILIIDASDSFFSENISLAFQHGANEYLAAGFSKTELKARVDKLLTANQFNLPLKEESDSISRKDSSLLDKLVLLMDKADNSFAIFNKDGELDWVNKGFCRLYGYEKEEFKQKFGRTIFEFSKNAKIVQKVETCIRTKKAVNYIAECQSKSGEFKWIQTTFTPVFGENGTLEHFIGIETDITKLKEAEEALNQKNEYMLALTKHLKSANQLLEQQQTEINIQNKQLEEERKKADELLLNILPFEVARQLKSKGEAKPRSYKLASVMFLDFVNFTDIARELSTRDLIYALDSYFKAFDEIIEKHFIEKIKTIGDAYMCAGGLPLSNKSNPFNLILAAFEILNYVNSKSQENATPNGLEWKCKIGISTGELIAGVVGKKKYIYDVWGHTVNIAARMQEQGQKGRVNISEYTYQYIKDYFDCSSRGMIATKRGLNLKMYFVNRIKPEYAADKEGFIPNEEFLKMINTL